MIRIEIIGTNKFNHKEIKLLLCKQFVQKENYYFKQKDN